MFEVIIRERHPKACPLDLRKVLGNRLQLLVIHQVNILWTNTGGEIERAFFAQRLGFPPSAIFPITTFRGYFTDINFRVEIRGERIAVIARITVDYVQVMNFIQMELFDVRGEYMCNTGIKGRATQRPQVSARKR